MSRKQEILKTLEAQVRAKRQNRLAAWTPYPKQKEFFALGATKRDRLLMASNQTGKSEAGAVEMAYHLTGEYPAWWAGRKWDRPVVAWTGGQSAQAVRQIQQTKLLGPAGLPDQAGTGLIPKSLIVKTSPSHGIADSLDTLHVRHTSGGVSSLQFKSFEQGREKWQGASVDVVWLDEECAMSIYSEALTRITATRGMLYMTFTPIMGITEVVARYLHEHSLDRAVVSMTIDDAQHISEEERAKIVAGYLPHERDARARGIPMLGSGKIFSTPIENLIEPLRVTPDGQVIHDTMGVLDTRAWRMLWSVDFGIGHNFAATLLAHDADHDVIYLLAEVRIANATPPVHVSAIRRLYNPPVRVAWPQDGAAREKSSGIALADIYRGEGLLMMDSHATFEKGGYSTEGGILEMENRMVGGRFKIAKGSRLFMEEYGMYHRREGLIVKERDDIMSATRVGVMAIRTARPVVPNSRRHAPQRVEGAEPLPWFY